MNDQENKEIAVSVAHLEADLRFFSPPPFFKWFISNILMEVPYGIHLVCHKFINCYSILQGNKKIEIF